MNFKLLRLRGWSLGAKLLLINALLIVALFVVTSIAWSALSSQSRAMTQLALVSKAARYHQDADTIRANLRADVNAALDARNLSAEERERVAAALADNAKDLRRDLSTLERFDLGPAMFEAETQVARMAEAFLSKTVEIGQLAMRDPAAAQGLLPQYRDAGDALDAAMLKQTAAFTALITRASDDATQAEANAKLWLVVAGILTNIAVGMLVAWVSASIRRSLKSVVAVADKMSQGDLAVRSEVSSRDEVGRLGHAINDMAGHLNEMIGRLRADANRDAFGSQLIEALEMADTEDQVYRVLSHSMTFIARDLPMELLLADSSRAHLESAARHPLAGAPGCDVESPFSCMAVRRGNPLIFPDSEALNACSRLRGRSCGPASAVCVPVSFMGRALGTLHASGPVGALPGKEQIAQLTTLGIQVGARIGTVRAFNTSQRKATTDSLTGLPNRRAAEDRFRQLAADTQTMTVVMADLDHFKRLNDTRGHEAGDQALRVFSEVLRSSLRHGDLAARWGGEEFVVLMPRTSAAQALPLVDRLRARLAEALLAGGVPAFTASFGIADTTMARQLEELLRVADEALYCAKDAGRDRAIVGTPVATAAHVARRPVEHPAMPDIHTIAGVD
jgi:diguanylate cyclase (GGDEF)-like protein